MMGHASTSRAYCARCKQVVQVIQSGYRSTCLECSRSWGGAPTGSRTRTPLRAAAFEAAASTSSATGASQEDTP